MKKIVLFPNLITTFGLACSLFVIFKVCLLPADQLSVHVFQKCVYLLLLSALADVLDGAVARMIHAESEFGVQFDSLSDAISFGVAPVVLLLKFIPMQTEQFMQFGITAAAMVYSICGVLRLVRFNISAQFKETLSEEEKHAQKKNFVGLPIPGAASAAISLGLFLVSHSLEKLGWNFSEKSKSILLMVALLLLGYLMVSRWKFPSLKLLKFQIRSFQSTFFTVLIAVLFFYAVLSYLPIAFFFISWGYIFISLSLSALRLVVGKKVKSLEDFDPETEDLP